MNNTIDAFPPSCPLCSQYLLIHRLPRNEQTDSSACRTTSDLKGNRADFWQICQAIKSIFSTHTTSLIHLCPCHCTSTRVSTLSYDKMESIGFLESTIGVCSTIYYMSLVMLLTSLSLSLVICKMKIIPPAS